jgi:carboxyl-terminal processing protease
MIKSRALLLFLAALAPLLALAQSKPSPISMKEKSEVLFQMEKVITKDAFVPGVDFDRWPEMIKKHRKALDAAETQVEFTGLVNGALREFGFSHIVLYSPQLAQQRTNRRMVGLGVRIQLEPNGIRVTGLFPGGPASQAGIQPGDLIVAADGKPVKGPADVQGEEDSKVRVKVLRDGKEQEFEIVRKAFSTDIPETIEWVNPKTAVVTIPTFDLGYQQKRVNELMKEAMKADNIILDLRGNGGGLVLNLMHLASFFFAQDDPLGTFVSKARVVEYEKATNRKGDPVQAVAAWVKDDLKLRPFNRSEQFKGSVAVLINGGTGSASEILAAALSEGRNSPLIGAQSAGAVLASYMRPVSNGFMLQYPVTDYVTKKGYRIEGNGLKPTLTAPPARYGEEDRAVALALQTFDRG